MDKMDMRYNVIGVVKSQICSAIVQSERVREALNFKGADCDDYDPEDPFTLIHNCVVPWIQYPDTITTTEPLVFVGAITEENLSNPYNPYLLNVTLNIICSVDKDNMKTQSGYFRKDLVESGYVCYTRADWIADEIIRCVSMIKGTWIGDIENIESKEYPMNNTRYARSISLRLREVNIGKFIQNG